MIVPAGCDLRALLPDADVDRKLGPMLTERLEDGFLHALAEMRERQGISTLFGGGAADHLTVLSTTAENVLNEPEILHSEMFGPATLIIEYSRDSALVDLAEAVGGQLTATIHADDADDVDPLVQVLIGRAGRLLWDGWPTGVTVSYAQQHGGPFPATTASGTTSVGTAAIRRFLRPVAFQDFPQHRLPAELQDQGPQGLRRRIDGVWTA
jgi:NADP-dependent aldehyde dehydrogenase